MGATPPRQEIQSSYRLYGGVTYLNIMIRKCWPLSVASYTMGTLLDVVVVTTIGSICATL